MAWKTTWKLGVKSRKRDNSFTFLCWVLLNPLYANPTKKTNTLKHINFMLKYYIVVSLQQFTKTLNQFFIYPRQTKIWKMYACLIYAIEWMKAVLRHFLSNFIGCFHKWTLSQDCKIVILLKIAGCEDMTFYVTITSSDTAAPKTFWIPARPQFFLHLK